MKPLLFVLSALIYLMATACSNSRSPYNDQVVSAARHDVSIVAEAPDGTIEREKAVLAIRVREHSLRSNGLEDEADLYIETARSLLVDSLHIIENRSIDNLRLE